MIGDDVLVFDCVAHPFNFDASNAIGNPGELFRPHLYAFHNVLMPESGPKIPAEEILKEWSIEEISRMVFDESYTDMLVAMPLPLTDFFHDGLPTGSGVPSCETRTPIARSSGGRSIPWRAARPLRTWRYRSTSTGAKAFKFYNVRYDYGAHFPWRMDDPKVAFPSTRRRRSSG